MLTCASAGHGQLAARAPTGASSRLRAAAPLFGVELETLVARRAAAAERSTEQQHGSETAATPRQHRHG